MSEILQLHIHTQDTNTKTLFLVLVEIPLHVGSRDKQVTLFDIWSEPPLKRGAYASP